MNFDLHRFLCPFPTSEGQAMKLGRIFRMYHMDCRLLSRELQGANRGRNPTSCHTQERKISEFCGQKTLRVDRLK
jgi:hypothetical protein